MQSPRSRNIWPGCRSTNISPDKATSVQCVAASFSRRARERGEVCRTLALLVAKALVGAARKQEIDGDGMVELGGDHQRGTAAIVLIVDMGAAVEQQSDHLVHVVDAGFVRISRRPHQHGQVVAIAGIDVDAMIEQQAHDVRKAPACRVSDRRLLGAIERIGIGSLLDQQFHDRLAAHIGRC